MCMSMRTCARVCVCVGRGSAGGGGGGGVYVCVMDVGGTQVPP